MNAGAAAAQRFAVVGSPVAHSRSPDIHQRFGEQAGIALSYTRMELAPPQFEAAVRRFFDEGGRGLNVTLPHKSAAFFIADHVGMRARVAGAANVLYLSEHGELIGENTDGTGLVRDLTSNLGVSLRGARVLLVGAGGAARGVVAPLLGQQPDALWIVNRTEPRAEALAESLSGFGPVLARRFDQLDSNFDLVINATSASFAGTAPALPAIAVAGAVCYDMVYGDGATPFMDWAGVNHARSVHDGWGMLVEQAAESFYLWHHVWPDTGPLLKGS